MDKRGQLTIFIIIGIIILVVFASFFVLRSVLVEEELEVARPIAEQIPTEFEPVRVFTDDCIELIAKQGLVRLGQQGGHIYPELWTGLYFNEQNPTDSDGLILGSAKIPYWWYNQVGNSQNTVSLDTNRPTISDMERDLKVFIETELPTCLNNYEDFEEQNYQVREGDITAFVDILPGSIGISVTHPLTVRRGPSEATFESFFVDLPVDLNKMYNVALEITEAEKEDTFLESGLVALIEEFSETDSNYLPPMTAHTFETIPTVSWNEQVVKQDIKNLLSSYVTSYRYLDSRNYYSYQYPENTELKDLKQRVYNNRILPFGNADDLDVRFQYLDQWDFYFDTNGEGDLIRPTSVNVDFFISKFGWQNYRTNYDVSYPVWISLYSPEALDNEGFQFNFALEANIRNNQPIRDNTSLFGPSSRFQESLVCDENQRNSGNITVRVYDAYNLNPIPEAAITYTVGDETCSIGLTDENGVFTGKFPIALGGSVTAFKENYLSHFEILDTKLDQPDRIDIALWRIKTVDFTITKKKLYNCKKTEDMVCYFGQTNITPPEESQDILVDSFDIEGSDRARHSHWLLSNTPLSLDSDEQAIITFERLSRNDQPFSSGSSVVGAESNTISLVPGTYRVTISILNDQELLIPAEERCVEEGGVIGGLIAGEQCFDVPDMEFPQFSSGGARWDSNTLMEITPSALYSTDEIIFKSLSVGLLDVPENARVHEDTIAMGKMMEYTQKLKNNLQPTYT